MNPFRKFAISKRNFHKTSEGFASFRSRYHKAIKPEKLQEFDTFLQLWGNSKFARISTFLNIGYPYKNTLLDKAIILVKMLLY